jgi:3-hydroxyacyl-[acyl-carrier-protein] dehydratase
VTEILDQALRTLPHGPEFRFITRLLSLQPGLRAEAEYVPSANLDFFRGHFPGNPIVPGVLLVEAVAQLGGIVAQTDPSIPPLGSLRLAGIRNAKITGAVSPGQIVLLEAAVLGRMGGLILVGGNASVDGVGVLRCEVSLAGQENA